MMAFDAVSREVCTARRIRTNTPLQALTTLNDPAYVDIARHFAKRMQQQAGNDPQKQIAWAYLQATFHKADERSMEAMLKLYQAAVKKFAADSAKTRRFVTDSLPASANFAAMTIVANAMLNLDEVVMKN
jgi:hypothetical protein